MANCNIPTNELNIKQTTGDTVYCYGLDINLSQADLPYIIPPPEQRRLPSLLNFVAYGDTVTLNGYLANPGKDIRIYARKIIFTNGAFIDNAGPDPELAKDFPPGSPAKQEDESPGAKGAAGAAGGSGTPAGNVVLMAESFEGQKGAGPGTVQIGSLDICQILKDICTAWSATVQQISDLDPFIFPAIHYPFSIQNIINGCIDIPDLRGSGLKNITFDYATWDPKSQNAIVQMSIKNLSCAGNCSLTFNPFPTPISFPVSFHGPEIDITMEWVINPLKRTVTQRQVNLSFDKIAFNYDLQQIIISVQVLIKAILDQIAPGLIPIVQQPVQDRLTKLLTTFSDPAVFGATPDLYILSKGGRGGRGEDGHSGIKGKMGNPGANSEQSTIWGVFPPPDSIGGKGATGGQGGDAGKSGPGAAGANISIGFINPTAVTLNYDNYGGDGGMVACPGSGGPGGDGGPPGTYFVIEIDPQTQMPIFKKVPSLPGPVGDTGPAASFRGAPGDKGAIGTLALNSPGAPGGDASKPLTYDQLGPLMKVEQLLIAQRAAAFSFLNAAKAEDYQYVLTLGYWLVKITAPVIQAGFTAPNWDSHDIATAKSIHDNALAMIGHCRRGLDFYGNYHNWVPILTLKDYQKRIDQLIGLGTIIEAQFRTYLDEQATAQKKLDALDQAIQSLNADIQNDQHEISQVSDQIKNLNDTINDLAGQLQQQQKLTFEDEAIFKEEVRKKAQEGTGCVFGDMINLITGIVTFGTGIANGIKTITSAYELFDEFAISEKTYENALKVIKQAEATVNGIKKGLDEIKKSALAPGEVGLVATKKEDFDKFIQNFIGAISSAQALKDAVDHYFDLIDARNQAICCYNALYIKRAAVQADLDQKTSRLEKVAAMRQQQVADPALPVYISFMQNAYANLKTIIVKKLYEENRALWYWSLQEQPFSTTDLNMATLSATHSSISTSIDSIKERKSGPYQPFTEEIQVSASDYPLAFRALPNTKKLVFALPVSMRAFLNQYQVIAYKFKLDFPDIQRKTDVLFVTMIHPGASYQSPNTGDPAVQFIHLPRVVSYKIDYANPHNTGGGQIGSDDEGYIGLSPFTTWTLNFDHPGNEFLDLNSIQSVVITFSGTYLGPPKSGIDFQDEPRRSLIPPK